MLKPRLLRLTRVNGLMGLTERRGILRNDIRTVLAQSP